MVNFKHFVTTILPTFCYLCQNRAEPHQVICQGCLADLPAIEEACTLCGISMLHPGVCGKCQRKPPKLNSVLTAYRYGYPVDRIIKKYKYKQDLSIARPLINALICRINNESSALPQAIVPVPLHYLRHYLKGFNQALEIAKIVGNAFNISVDAHSLQRKRATAPQYRLTPQQRKNNLAGAFRIKKPVSYRSIAIVDDIITTGATGNEIAKLYRQAGVKHIELWALARAD